MIRLSIVVAVYNSHEIVRRQTLHLNRMNLSNGIETIFVDDGSNPPLDRWQYRLKNFTIAYTNEKRPWTQGLARNMGSELARGKYILFTDIDHILSREAIMDAYNFNGSKMIFPRFFGVLLEDGTLTQDMNILIDYGFDTRRIKMGRGLYASYHGNTYAIKKKTFEQLGRYNPKKCLYGYHAPHRGGEDGAFNRVWNHWARDNNIHPIVGSKIYMFPIGRYHKNGELNPKGLFHNLNQEQEAQPLKD
ncbi:MAG: glycosyltransferase [Atribacterota bacterium]|nr:glycosyltransferase [Atribacterota bacterium]